MRVRVQRAHGDQEAVCQLKVTLKQVRPPIWRRLLVPSDIKLDKLHAALQASLGWTNSHLHQYVLGKVLIGMADVDNYAPIIDETKIRLDEIAAAKTRFTYEYDFGDGWEHDVLVENVLPAEPGQRYPWCIAGERACPPEDCGGVSGYEELLEIIANPKHEEHTSMMQWLGGTFDPDTYPMHGPRLARGS